MSTFFIGSRSRPSVQQETTINVKTPSLTRTPLGGGKSKSYEASNLKRSAMSERPKLVAGKQTSVDNAVTVGGKKAWLLERMAKFRPVTDRQQTSGIKGLVRRPPPSPPKTETSQTDTTTKDIKGVAPEPQVQKSPEQLMDDRVSVLGTKVQLLARHDGSGELRTESERREAEVDHRKLAGEVRGELKSALSDIGKSRTDLKGKIADLERKAGNLRQQIENEVKSGGDKTAPDTLKGLTTELSKVETGLNDLATKLKTVEKHRASLIDATITLQMPGVGPALKHPINPQSALMGLKLAYAREPDLASRNDAMTTIDHLGKMIEAFNQGESKVAGLNGRLYTVAEFKTDVVDAWAKALKQTGDKDFAQVAKSLQAVSGELEHKVKLDALRESISKLLDEQPEFPITNALHVMAGALPNLRDNAISTDRGRALLALDGMCALFELMKSGQDFTNLQGIDKSFDAAYLKFKQKAAGEAAVEHYTTLCENSGEPIPTSEQLRAAAKPLDKCSGSDQLVLKAFAMANNLDSLEAAHSKINSFVATSQKRRQEGMDAAKLRHDLNQMNKTLGDILTGDRRRVFAPSTWFDSNVRVFSDGPHSVRKDEKLFDALVSYAGKQHVKDVTILFARIAQLEVDTLKAEQRLFGAHTSDRIEMPKGIGEGDQSKGPLSAFGITNAKLEKLGVTFDRNAQNFDESAEVSKVIEGLSKQGIGSLQEVRDTIAAINKVATTVFKSELTQEMVREYEQTNTRALGQRLVNELVRDIGGDYQRLHPNETLTTKGKAPTALTDPIITKAMHDRAETLQFKLGSPLRSDPSVYAGDRKQWQRLKAEGEFYAEIENAVVGYYTDLKEIDETTQLNQTFLKAESENLKMRLDPNAPKGLESSKLILTALQADADYRASGGSDRRSQRRRDEALRELRGYDASTGHRAWYSKIGLGKEPTIDDLRPLREVAESIVYLREGVPHMVTRIERQLTECAQLMNDVLEARRETDPQAMQQATDLIRMAVLAEWNTTKGEYNFDRKDGTITETFDPASPETRKRIETRLKEQWGLDIDRFRPELDDVLMSRMSADDLIRWSSEAEWGKATREQYLKENPGYTTREAIAKGFKTAFSEIGRQFTLDGLLNRRVVDEKTRMTLLSTVQSLQEGDKIDLKSGQRVTLNSGKIPVDPTGLAGLQLKLSGARVGQFEIERGSSGYKLSLRMGLEGKGSLDAIVGKKFKFAGGLVELTAQGSVGVEGSGSKLDGVTFSFEGNDKGLTALVDLIAKMVDTPDQIGLSDWKDSTDVSRSDETRKKAGLNANLLARVVGGGKAPQLDDKKNLSGVGVNAQGQGNVAIGSKGNVIRSINQQTTKGEIEYSMTLGASVNFYANIYNPMNIATGLAADKSGAQTGSNETFGKNSSGSSNYDMTNEMQATDILGVGASRSYVCSDKWKIERDGDGTFKKCEVVRQANVKVDVLKAFAICGTSDMELKLKDEKFREEFRSFMTMCKTGDFLQATYGLRPEKLSLANELMQYSIEARRNNDPESALRYEAEAQQIVDDDDSYRLEKFALVNTTVKKSEISNINATYVRWDTYAEGKREITRLTFKVV